MKVFIILYLLCYNIKTNYIYDINSTTVHQFPSVSTFLSKFNKAVVLFRQQSPG